MQRHVIRLGMIDNVVKHLRETVMPDLANVLRKVSNSWLNVSSPDDILGERDGVDLQAVDAVFDQFVRGEVLGELGGVDLPGAALLAGLGRDGLVGVADLLAKKRI